MKNPVQALPDCPVTPLKEQSDRAKKAPETPPLHEIAAAKNATLHRDLQGRFYLRKEEEEYFNGKRWLPFDEAGMRRLGISCAAVDDPRLRMVQTEKEISAAQAREWFFQEAIPMELQSQFAKPLARGSALRRQAKDAAAVIGISPDAFVCHAVEVFVEYVRRPESHAKVFKCLDPETVVFLEGVKYEPSEPARALFNRIRSEALEKPMKEALELLAALRDFTVANPGFHDQCEALGAMLDGAELLDVMGE